MFNKKGHSHSTLHILSILSAGSGDDDEDVQVSSVKKRVCESETTTQLRYCNCDIIYIYLVGSFHELRGVVVDPVVHHGGWNENSYLLL